MIGLSVAVASVVFLTVDSFVPVAPMFPPAPAPAPAPAPGFDPVDPVEVLIYLLTRVIFATDSHSNYGGYSRTVRDRSRCIGDKSNVLSKCAIPRWTNTQSTRGSP